MPANGRHYQTSGSDRDPQNLYETGVRLLLDGDEQGALKCFKDIYEVDYKFRDVAQIVENSYAEHCDWAAELRARIRERSRE